MFAKVCVLISLMLYLDVVLAKKPLPSYVKPCSLSDPNLEKCMLDSGNSIVKSIMNGDKEYNIPSLSPLSITKIELDTGKDLSIKLEKVKIYGIDKTELKTIKRISPNELAATFHTPLLNLTGDYEIHGKLLVLPIEGKGLADVEAKDGDFNLKLIYETIDKDGEKYAKFSKESSLLTSDFKGITFSLSNLFNGDKALGDQTNKFLNENWQDVGKELIPAILEAIDTYLVEVINRITLEAPENEVFLA